MNYFEYLDDQAEIQQREERQELKDRVLPPEYDLWQKNDGRPDYRTLENHSERVETIAKAIRIAIASAVLLVSTVHAQNAPPTPLEQLARAEYLMATAIDPGDLRAATWHMVMAKAAVVNEQRAADRKALKDARDDAYTRYLRYKKANRRRIDRLNRQAAGIAAKFRSMTHQAGIQAEQRHRATPHYHPH